MTELLSPWKPSAVFSLFSSARRSGSDPVFLPLCEGGPFVLFRFCNSLLGMPVLDLFPLCPWVVLRLRPCLHT